MKILEICVDLDGGGIDRYLLNYCSRINDIDFDFACVDNNKVGVLEQPIKDLGCNIYKVKRQSAGVIKYYKALKKIMTENKYDAVHVHLGYRGMVALFCAKMCGIKCRISHAHIAFEPEGKGRKLLRKVCTVICKSLSTHLAGCGVDAAKWLWGTKSYEKGKVKIHNNAIDGNKFKFSPEIRKRVRNDLGISNETLAVGHVGRLCDQKNQLRLVEIFAEIKKIRPDALLYMVGRGEKEKAIIKRAEELGISNAVKLLGIRDDVHELLNAFDVFVFPSTHEGLPFTLIETQCNGLYALSADTVTPLVKVSACVEFISLDETDRVWAEKSMELAEKGHSEVAHDDVVKAGYDINAEAEKLEKYYLDCIRECKK
ncbi:MAG: glycosyltransferase [Clostridia bacterium]|nr:glycosyltransferase [Clostridia bacterium]